MVFYWAYGSPYPPFYLHVYMTDYSFASELEISNSNFWIAAC